MADFVNGQPVITMVNGDVSVSLCDGSTVANKASVDASGNLSAILGAGSASIGKVVIEDIAISSQTDDLKVTLDSELVVLGLGTAIIGSVKITDGTETAAVDANNSLQVAQFPGEVWQVSISPAAVTGEIHHYQKSPAPLAPTAVDDHEYPVPAGKIMILEQLLASGGGNIRGELVIDAITYFTMFGSGGSGNNIAVTLAEPIEVAATVVIHWNIKNEDKNTSRDVYSTIIGRLIDV